MYKVLKTNPVFGMTLINPRLSKQRNVEIRLFENNEGPIPHVHVYWDHTCDPHKCSIVRLDRAEYSTHHNQNPAMPKRVKKEFLEIMEAVISNIQISFNDRWVNPTGYEYAISVWCEAYEIGDYSKFDVNEEGRPVMPDYSKL